MSSKKAKKEHNKLMRRPRESFRPRSKRRPTFNHNQRAPRLLQRIRADYQEEEEYSDQRALEFVECIQHQMNDIAQALDKLAQYFVLSGSFFTLVLKDSLVSKHVITEEQAIKLSTLKADDVNALWSEHSLDEEFKMEWKKNRHKKDARSLDAPDKSPRQVNSVYSKPFSLLMLVNAFDVNGVMGSVSATISVTERAQSQQPQLSQQL
jgi:hypothetical protein